MAYSYKVKINDNVFKNFVAEFYDKDLLHLFIDSLLEKDTTDEICIVKDSIDVYCPDNEDNSTQEVVKERNVTTSELVLPNETPSLYMYNLTKTISHFESLQKRYRTQHNDRMCERVFDALQALYFCRDCLYPDGDRECPEKDKNPFEEFKKRHCEMCGTQRCGGVYDEDFREGCEYYQHEILHQKTLKDILYGENKSET